MWSCLYFRTEWNGSWRQTPGRIRLVRVPLGADGFRIRPRTVVVLVGK